MSGLATFVHTFDIPLQLTCVPGVICALRIEYVVPLLAPLLSTARRKMLAFFQTFFCVSLVCVMRERGLEANLHPCIPIAAYAPLTPPSSCDELPTA